MADKIEVNYEVLREVHKKFTLVADNVGDMAKKVDQTKEALHDNGWQGKGSDAFYAEMNDDFAPALRQLREGLGKGSSLIGEIVKVMQTAEEEAASIFKAVTK